MRDVPADALRAAQLLWAAVDSPWIQHVDAAKFGATIEPLRAFDPQAILSTHLPPALDHSAALFDMLSAAPDADPFVGPDQQALEQLLAGFEPVAAEAG